MTADIENEEHGWLVAFLREIKEGFDRTEAILTLTIEGVSALTTIPSLFDAIYRSKSRTRKPEDVERTAKFAELAQREVDDGFSLTLTQHTVDIWGLLEASIRNFLVKWLEHEANFIDIEGIKKLKVRLFDYEQCTGQERQRYLISLLEREDGGNLKSGSDKFESLLSHFELSGRIPKPLKTKLYELSKLRNCIVHNNRVVDRQFNDSCPWLEYEVGKTVKLKLPQVMIYQGAVLDYLILIICRASAKVGAGEVMSYDEFSEKWPDA